MGFRERWLMKMDRPQVIVLTCVILIPLILQVSTQLYYFNYYFSRALHVKMLIAVILILINPKGVRILLFAFFTYLLIQILNEGSYLEATLLYALEYCLFGLPLFWLGLSIKSIIYFHIFLSALLAYFSYRNPFQSRRIVESEVIDQLD